MIKDGACSGHGQLFLSQVRSVCSELHKAKPDPHWNTDGHLKSLLRDEKMKHSSDAFSVIEM